MGYRFEFDRERELLRFESRGILSAPEILQAVRDLVEHADFEPGRSILVDLSSVDEVRISGPDLRTRVQLDKSLAQQIGKARFAVLVEQDYVFGLARMWQAMMGDTSVQIEVFRELEPALEWLDRP